MADVPSVKGSLFRMPVASLRNALKTEKTTRGELARWLSESDFDYIDTAEITMAGWYPADSFQRISDAVLQVIAGGRVDHYREEGAKAVSGFMGSGAYKGFMQSAENQIEKAGQILVGASEMLFNFSKWSFQGDLEHGFQLEVEEAELIPDSLCYAIVGFFEAFFSQVANVDMDLRWERPRRDHIIVTGKPAAGA
jgi:hypothetical protein